MQKKNLLLILFMQIYALVNGQNLVPNNSFENYGTLPCSWITTQTGFANAMQNWTMPTSGSTDIFSTLVNINCYAHCLSTSNSAVGQQLPRTGNVTSAILTYGTGGSLIYREYLQVQLTSPLVVGNQYYAEMYVSHTDFSKEASNNIGMYFSDTLVNVSNSSNPLNFTPQINETTIITNDTGWVKISGTFTATTPAQYLILGNFYDNNNTSIIYYANNTMINARYYVDDVSVFESCFAVSNDTSICIGDSATLLALTDSIIGWADNTSPNVIISTDSAFVISPTATTTYLLFSYCDTFSITVTVNSIPIVNLGNDTTVCQIPTLTLNGGTANSYLWSTGSTDSSIIVSNSTTYWVQASNGECAARDSINVTFYLTPYVNLGNDTTLCQGQTISLNGGSAISYLWSNSSTTSSINVSNTGTYWVQANNGLCSNRDSINISFNSIPTPSLGNDTTLCQGQTITLNAGLATSYLWSNSSTSSSINVSNTGTYWVQANNGLCSNRDSINITFNSIPTPSLGNDTTLCQGQTITLNAGSATSYLWSNSSTSSSINVSNTGTYWVQANNGLCSNRDSINITFNSIPTPSLGNDTTLCQGQTITLNAGSATSYLWSNSSTSSSINVSNSGIYWVQVSNGQCTNRDSLSLTIFDCDIEIAMPNVFTPNNDGINDNFIPLKYKGIAKANLTIFNRWGKKIFYTDDLILGWNGIYRDNISNEGTYYWIVQYTTIINETKDLNGFLMLLK